MYKCPYCEKDFDFRLSMAAHCKWCKYGPNRSKSVSRSPGWKCLDSIKVSSCEFCGSIFESIRQSNGHRNRCIKNPNRVINKIFHLDTDITKEKKSLARSKYLANHPEHNICHYGSSNPELYLGELLRKWSIEFLSQYSRYDLWKKNYRIDYYLPKYSIGIEVNGSFKYESENILLEYYRKRNATIENSGIRIVNIWYRDVYKLTKENLFSLMSPI